MKKSISLIFILLLSTASLYAQKKMRIVMLDLKPNNISKPEAIAITNLLQSNIVDSDIFLVVERNQINAILKEQGLQQTGCTDSTCAVEVGRLLSANKILMGNVNKLGSMILLTVRIVDVGQGVSQFSVNGKAKSINSIDDAVNAVVKKLVAKLGGKMSNRFDAKMNPPKDFKITVGEYKNKVKLKWQPVKEADRYLVYRSENINGLYDNIGIVKKESNFTDNQAKEGKTYYYKVKSAFYSSTSEFSEIKEGRAGYSKTGIYMRGILPGLGQLYTDNNLKGYIIMGSFIVTAALTGLSYLDYKDSLREYRELDEYPRSTTDKRYIDKYNSAYNEVKTSHKFFLYSLGLVTAIYIYNWIDLLFINSPPYKPDGPDKISNKSFFVDINCIYTAAYINNIRYNDDIRYNLVFGVRF